MNFNIIILNETEREETTGNETRPRLIFLDIDETEAEFLILSLTVVSCEVLLEYNGPSIFYLQKLIGVQIYFILLAPSECCSNYQTAVYGSK